MQEDLLKNFEWEVEKTEWKDDCVRIEGWLGGRLLGGFKLTLYPVRCLGREASRERVGPGSRTYFVDMVPTKLAAPGLLRGIKDLSKRSGDVPVLDKLELGTQDLLCCPQNFPPHAPFRHPNPSQTVDGSECGRFWREEGGIKSSTGPSVESTAPSRVSVGASCG